MIKESDVVSLFVPFPNTDANLALNAHMYICHKVVEGETDLIKCQTFKNKYFIQNEVKHKVVEDPDINRNPFIRKSLIDCDKLFQFIGVYIPEALLAKRRRDVCPGLFRDVETELSAEGYTVPEVNLRELVDINGLL
ncbi:hypothetical protein [Lactiplantibacillus plantarum]|uniref:hypothetical protein n=1 Tax=Lactiplantibacillus plantarum TaxID=1590 RepID=UPI00092FE0B1|nr:hypothetical protein [Lactiplantibacillus plantarum]